jgi:putative spermidine/putrescine transport system ATP-binding protein
MAFLVLENITKHFGRTTAVDQINLAVERGEFLTLLGPSGCGKTTILRMIAGFEVPSAGAIFLDEEEITSRAASKRPMGMVFQSYALFPHLTAEQNIAFGMSIQRKPKERIQRRCAELLALVGLSERGRSYPHQLSGGQQQRVALARALAIEPKVLLLDEPLSALDARVRVSLREEIRRIQQQLHMTAIYVTHDQEEALAISDRIAVLAQGRLEQLDQPEQVYSHPRTVFAASFVGTSNQFRAVLTSAAEGICQWEKRLLHVLPVADLPDGTAVLVLVRPEGVSFQQRPEADEQERNHSGNRLQGVIELRTFLGPFTRFQVRVDDQTTLTADIPSQQAREYTLAQHVLVTFSPDACLVLPLDEQEVRLVKEAASDLV